MTQTTDLADALLLRRMAGGDEDAFAEVYRQKHPAIYRFALHMTGNASVAEDVTQEVFMALIRDPNDSIPPAVRWADFFLASREIICGSAGSRIGGWLLLMATRTIFTETLRAVAALRTAYGQRINGNGIAAAFAGCAKLG